MTVSSAIDLAPIVSALAPFVAAIAVALVAGAIRFAAAELAKYTGVRIDQHALDRLNAAVAAEAGSLVAAASDNLATASIPVGSPTVAAIANRILANIPEATARLGVTPDQVAAMVAGKIGELQSHMTTVAPVAKAS